MHDPKELLAHFGSPLYVYDESSIRDRCRALRAAFDPAGVGVLYAMKANANPDLVAVVREEGLGIDAVSGYEVELARRCGFAPERVSFTANNVDDAELAAVRAHGVEVTLDSVAQLERYGRNHPGTSVGLRLNPEFGGGHHEHVITGGPDSKFGVEPAAIEDALAAAARHRVTIEVVQQHVGSGILDADILLRALDRLLELALRFPRLRVVDFGGGFGIPYREGEAPLDLARFGAAVGERLRELEARAGLRLAARCEPGRYVVASSGTLYVTVTAVKRTRYHTFVGTDSGMNHLLRPALYGSYHRIENVTHPGGTPERVHVAGNICESGDLLARDAILPTCREGDLLAIRDVGAYGYSMASNYNLRPRPAEVMLRSDGPHLIRRRETLDDLLARTLPFGPQ